MQAPDSIDVGATEARVRGACLVGGCTCKDPRIVSRRRAAFFAAMALRSGETARRVIAAEDDWRLPETLSTVAASVVAEEPTHADVPTKTTYAPTYAHGSESGR